MGRHKGVEGRRISMDARMLDVVTGVTSLAVFIVALIFLPTLNKEWQEWQGLAYLLAIVIFIVLMSGSGALIKEKIT